MAEIDQFDFTDNAATGQIIDPATVKVETPESTPVLTIQSFIDNAAQEVMTSKPSGANTAEIAVRGAAEVKRANSVFESVLDSYTAETQRLITNISGAQDNLDEQATNFPIVNYVKTLTGDESASGVIQRRNIKRSANQLQQLEREKRTAAQIRNLKISTAQTTVSTAKTLSDLEQRDIDNAFNRLRMGVTIKGEMRQQDEDALAGLTIEQLTAIDQGTDEGRKLLLQQSPVLQDNPGLFQSELLERRKAELGLDEAKLRLDVNTKLGEKLVRERELDVFVNELSKEQLEVFAAGNGVIPDGATFERGDVKEKATEIMAKRFDAAAAQTTLMINRGKLTAQQRKLGIDRILGAMPEQVLRDTVDKQEPIILGEGDQTITILPSEITAHAKERFENSKAIQAFQSERRMAEASYIAVATEASAQNSTAATLSNSGIDVQGPEAINFMSGADAARFIGTKTAAETAISGGQFTAATKLMAEYAAEQKKRNDTNLESLTKAEQQHYKGLTATPTENAEYVVLNAGGSIPNRSPHINTLMNSLESYSDVLVTLEPETQSLIQLPGEQKNQRGQISGGGIQRARKRKAVELNNLALNTPISAEPTAPTHLKSIGANAGFDILQMTFKALVRAEDIAFGADGSSNLTNTWRKFYNPERQSFLPGVAGGNSYQANIPALVDSLDIETVAMQNAGSLLKNESLRMQVMKAYDEASIIYEQEIKKNTGLKITMNAVTGNDILGSLRKFGKTTLGGDIQARLIELTQRSGDLRAPMEEQLPTTLTGQPFATRKRIPTAFERERALSGDSALNERLKTLVEPGSVVDRTSTEGVF